MIRLLTLAAALFLALPALADSPPTLLPGTMPSLSQGRPSQQRFAPAPVPNPDILPPRSQRDAGAVEISPNLTRTPTSQRQTGDGFARGSAYSGELERLNRSIGIGSTLAPSLNLKVPVQVDVGQGRP